MTNLIVGQAFDPRVGMCDVEDIGNDYFRLIPTRNPFNRLIRHRSQIQWRQSKEAA